IRFAVDARIDTGITGRLAAEVFQMIVEAMSNVLRHTASKSGFVAVRCQDGAMTVKIGNRLPDEVAAALFQPRSIAERTQSLGGTLAVQPLEDGHTVVEIAIPL
ncbi:MAG: hypothetical protein ACM3SS_21810, partial [Rhodospirillaceae bacterium]